MPEFARFQPQETLSDKPVRDSNVGRSTLFLGGLMRRWLLALGCAMLAGCSDGAVKEAIKDGLIDPESAQFGEISYSDNGKMACAEVNAKNRMGGYTGDKQIYLAKIDGEWTYVGDFEEGHETCVESINEMEKREANSAKTANFATPADTVELAPTTSPAPATAGSVAIVAIDPVWIQITDGGVVLKQGELAAGQRYDVPANSTAPQLTTGKPEALRVMVGSSQAPAVGEAGRTVSGLSLRASDLLQGASD